MSFSGFLRCSSDMDIGQVHIPCDLQQVDHFEALHPMLEIEDELTIGIHMKAIGIDADGQIKGLSWTKRIIRDVPLLRSPFAIQDTVPHHNTLLNTGIDVQGYVPRGSHIKVNGKSVG